MGIGTILSWAIFGLVAGAIARLLHPGSDPMNWVYTMVLGILGSVVGGYVVGLMGVDANNWLIHWIAAIAGAILLLMLYHFTTARKASSIDGSSATTSDYKKAVFDDLSRGPNG